MKINKAFVTGGAGFIGSHLVDCLVKNYQCNIVVYDNLSTGQQEFFKHHQKKQYFKFIKGDILDLNLLKNSIKGSDFIFHLAANADIRGGLKKTRVDLEQNTIGTYNVLEAMRINKIKKLAFSSSAAVYGEPTIIPTPEDNYLRQTSLYGASKSAGESLIEAFSEAFGIKSWIFRFVSVMGERYPHGVVFDFVKKLLKTPKKLKILGNGKQKKSYIYIGDLINGICTALEKAKEKVNIFNLGNSEYCDVISVAEYVADEMKLKPKYIFQKGERGWIGDAPFVFLNIEKMKKLGWKPKLNLEQTIRLTVRYLLNNKWLIEKR